MKTHKWADLRAQMPAEHRAEVNRRVAAELKQMPLYRLRQARRLTQKQLGEAMRIDQSRVSKIERRPDVYVSTLRNFIGAMGGELELVAKFPDGRVKIGSLGDEDLIGIVEDDGLTPDFAPAPQHPAPAEGRSPSKAALQPKLKT